MSVLNVKYCYIRETFILSALILVLSKSRHVIQLSYLQLTIDFCKIEILI